MFREMWDELMQHVEDCVITAIQENQSPEAEDGEEEVDSPGTHLVAELDKLMSENEEPQMSQQHDATSSQLGHLAQEFSTSEKTSPAVDSELARIIEGLINNKLPKAKLDELTERYHRPENSTFLLAPKANKTIWSQLKDSTKKADIGMQMCFISDSGVCNSSSC